MRVALANRSRGRIGGVETYLGNLSRALHSDGHRVALLHEVDGPLTNGSIEGDTEAVWSVAALGLDEALSRMATWGPDAVLECSIGSPDLEYQLASRWPSVIFPGGYHGTCISGAKSFKFPTPRPCGRTFGPSCLAYYFPRRCGGLSPVTMLRNYTLGARRLGNLKLFRRVIVASEHMRREFLRHGILPQRLRVIPYAVARTVETTIAPITQEAKIGNPNALRLLFVGRMTATKGGPVAMEAMVSVASDLGRSVVLTIAGEGPQRDLWEQKAAQVMAASSAVRVEFTGWLNRARLDSLLVRTDLLVVPSIWPEPFGLVGPEAGLHGVPQTAFAVGGIPEWLIDGVNGYLAPGDPPTAKGLAHAIVKCLRDPQEHARLRSGAVEIALRFNLARHMATLLGVFEEIVCCSNNLRTEIGSA